MPGIQSGIASLSASIISKKTNSKITIDKVAITPGLTIILKEINIHDNADKPILDAGKIEVSRLSLRRKARILKIASVKTEDVYLGIHTAPGDSLSNFSYFTDNFTGESNNDTTSTPWKIEVSRISLANIHFENRDFNKIPAPSGIDWNHNVMDNIFGEIKNLNITDSLITARIRHLSFNEKSGFSINNLSGEIAYNERSVILVDFHLQTPHSDVNFDYSLSYNSINDFQDFLNKVIMSGEFRQSRLALDDLVFFVPDLQGLEDIAWIKGTIKGSVGNLTLKDFEVVSGKSTHIKTDLKMIGLPDIENTYIRCKLKTFYITREDLLGFSLPSTDPTKHLSLPSNLDSLEYCSLSGDFTGFPSDFVAVASAQTNLGMLNTDLQLFRNKLGNLEYHGLLNGKDIEAGKLSLQEDLLGTLDMKINIDGSGTSADNINVALIGTVDSVIFMNNQLNTISINGSFVRNRAFGRMILNDELGNLDISGFMDTKGKNPQTDLVVQLEEIDLYGLHLTDSLHKAKISTTLTADATGVDPDRINGTITAEGTTYILNGDTLHLDQLYINQKSTGDSTFQKVVFVNSDMFDLYSSGSIPYAEFAQTAKNYITKIAPRLIQSNSAKDSINWSESDFIANIKFKNTEDFTRLFIPHLSIPDGGRARIEYNGENRKSDISLYAGEINFSGITFNDLELNTEIDSLQGDIRLMVKEIVLLEASPEDTVPVTLQNFKISSLIENDTVHLYTEYDDFSLKDKNRGFLTARASLSDFPDIEITLLKNRITYNDTVWHIPGNNRIMLTKEGTSFKNVGIRSPGQELLVEGRISNNVQDTLHAEFTNLNLQVLDLFMPEEIRFDGLLNGNASLTGLSGSPNFISDLSIENFSLNNEKMGQLLASTTWNQSQNHLDVLGDLIYTGNIGSDTTLFIRGFYAPNNGGTFDFNIGTKNFNVEVIRPWLEGIASNISGRMTGNMNLYGTPSEPVITGRLRFTRTGLKIDYTKVDYTFADYIVLEKNAILFDDFTITDYKGNRLFITGALRHNHFQDFKMDLNLDFKKLNVLRTSSMDNSSFYGDIFTTGNLKLKGLLDQMYLTAGITTTEGTNVTVPISYSVDVGNMDYITFINNSDTLISETEPQPTTGSGINIDSRIQVDPSTKMQIFLPDNMGDMDVTGYGDIRYVMDDQYNYEIFGDYEIDAGYFTFTLQNIIRKKFKIRSGGTITLNGDAMDAELNVKAVYKLRASLNGIPTADTTISSLRIPVECVLGLSGPVSNPIIDFGIELPNVDAQTKEIVFSAIDTTNNTVMTQQMLSLLVLNSFTFSSPNTALTSGLGATSFDILTNQLSNWLSQISKDFDVGINYRPGDEITQEEVEVALRTQLFDDRVIIDGNIGVMGTDNTENTSNIVGDVNVEFKITKDGRFRLKAFNKSNETDLLNNTSPYTQGVGISYFTEFDKFGDLFKRKPQSSSKRK